MNASAESKSTQLRRLEGAALRLLTDERLARLAAGGDRVAFAVIFDRYHQALFGYCASILRNQEDAADAVQSTMLRAMRALEGEERAIAVRPWLYRIAHNESIELLRRPRTEDASSAEVVRVQDVEADAAVRAHLRAVLDDIRELPDRQRGALVMRELAGLSYDDIAVALETTAAGAKQAVYDARQALHQLAKGRDSDCDLIRHKLSDGDRRVFRGRTVRAHLTACADCRSWQEELAARETSWAAFAPTMPAAAAASALHAAAGGGAGAAAAGSFVSAAAMPAIATVAVAVVLGAGAVGVHELNKGGDQQPPARVQAALSTPATGTPVSTRDKPGDRRSATRRGGRGDAKSRADRARERALLRRERARRAARNGKKGGDREAGAGSTALGGGGTRLSGQTTRSGGGGGNSLLGGRGGGRSSGGNGPVRSTVDDTRDAVEGTVNQVQGVVPVATPQLPPPVVRPPGGDQPKDGARPSG